MTASTSSLHELLGVHANTSETTLAAPYKLNALEWHSECPLKVKEEVGGEIHETLLRMRDGCSSQVVHAPSSSRASSIYSFEEFQEFDRQSGSSCTSASRSSDFGPAASSSRTSIPLSKGSWVDTQSCSRTSISDGVCADSPVEASCSGQLPIFITSLLRRRKGHSRFHTCPSAPRPKLQSNAIHLPFLYPSKRRAANEQTYAISVSLEDLFWGKTFRFPMDRVMRSGRKRHTVVQVDVPPGCPHGTRIRCHACGDERKDGGFNDLVFVVEQEPHDLFYRVERDLVLEATMPWDPKLEKEAGTVRFRGLDGEQLSMKVDYPNERVHSGCHVIFGAGMPTYGHNGDDSVRGDLFVRWQIESPPVSKRQIIKRIFHLG